MRKAPPAVVRLWRRGFERLVRREEVSPRPLKHGTHTLIAHRRNSQLIQGDGIWWVVNQEHPDKPVLKLVEHVADRRKTFDSYFPLHAHFFKARFESRSAREMAEGIKLLQSAHFLKRMRQVGMNGVVGYSRNPVIVERFRKMGATVKRVDSDEDVIRIRSEYKARIRGGAPREKFENEPFHLIVLYF